MNVCMMIFNYWPGPQGGTENQCRLLSKALLARGTSCMVLTTRSARGLRWVQDDDGVRIVRLPTLDGLWRKSNEQKGHQVTRGVSGHTADMDERQPWSAAVMMCVNALLFQVGASVYLWCHRRRIDVFHVHTSEWISGFAAWIGARLGKPVVCKVATLPTMRPLERGIPFRHGLATLRQDCQFIAQNHEQVSDLCKAGIGEARIRVIPNSVSLPDLSQRQPEKNLALFVGNLTQMNAHKAFDVLFDAWAAVHAVHPPARLLVVGAGDASEWKARLQEGGALDSVEFVGRVEDVGPYYCRAAVFLLPSRQEGLSNALLEAQSWGIPAVVSDIPGNRAVVTDGQNGRVVPVNDVTAFSQGIVDVLEDNPRRVAMGTQARERMKRDFDIAGIAEDVESTYESLVSNAVA